jgi:hypothetical protein
LRLRCSRSVVLRSGPVMLCPGSDVCRSGPDGLCAARAADLCGSGSDVLCSGCTFLLCPGCAVLCGSRWYGSGTATGPGCSGSSSGRAGSEAESLV